MGPAAVTVAAGSPAAFAPRRLRQRDSDQVQVVIDPGPARRFTTSKLESEPALKFQALASATNITPYPRPLGPSGSGSNRPPGRWGIGPGHFSSSETLANRLCHTVPVTVSNCRGDIARLSRVLLGCGSAPRRTAVGALRLAATEGPLCFTVSGFWTEEPANKPLKQARTDTLAYA